MDTPHVVGFVLVISVQTLTTLIAIFINNARLKDLIAHLGECVTRFEEKLGV